MRKIIFFLIVLCGALHAQDIASLTLKRDATIALPGYAELHKKIKNKFDKGQYATSNPRLYLPKEYKLKKNRMYAYIEGRFIEYKVLGNGDIKIDPIETKYHSYNFSAQHYSEIEGDDSYVRPDNAAAKIKKLKEKDKKLKEKKK